MRMRNCKTPGDRLREFFANSSEVHVAVEVVDNNLKAIVLTGTEPFSGSPVDRVVIKVLNTYSDTLNVLEQEPPMTEEKWVLRGAFFGSAFERRFDSEAEAVRLKERMEGAADSGEVDLKVVPVQVPVESVE